MGKKDLARLSRIRGLRCCLWLPIDPSDECAGSVEAHHPTGAGMALKSDDSKAFPLCMKHHREFHDASGAFKTWNKAERRAWQALMVQRYAEV